MLLVALGDGLVNVADALSEPGTLVSETMHPSRSRSLDQGMRASPASGVRLPPLIAGGCRPAPSLEPSNAGFMVVIVSYGVVGLVLTERRPENSIGSIFLGVAGLWS